MPSISNQVTKGTRMKKTALVLGMAIVLVFAFASTALADTASGTITWNPAAPNNNPSPSTPHKGYAYNTQKCLVCHAVHKSSAVGQVLLDTTVSNSCNFCHVSVAGIATKHVYNNDPTTFASDTVFNHSNACTTCHAVHGSNTVDQPGLSSSILKRNILTGPQVGRPASWDITSGGTDVPGAMSAFCTQCHPYYTGTYADSDADGNVIGSFNVGGPYNSHIMTSDYVSYDPANGASQTGIAVAYASSAYCQSCHDGGSGSVADNFPHLTLGAGFMKSSNYVNDTAVNAVTTTEDGVCLKCHRGTGGLVGVGIGF